MKHCKIILPIIILLLMAVAIGPKCWADQRAARFVQGCFRYSNWDAPHLTLDVCLDTTLTSIIVPDSIDWNGRKYPVVEIGPGAFRKCHYLSYLELGSCVASILKDALINCPNLRVIKFRSKEPPKLNLEHPFHGVENWSQIIDSYHTLSTVLVVPEGCEDAYRNAPGWKEFKMIQSHMPDGSEMKIDELDVRINELESELLKAKQLVNRIEDELDALRKAKEF